MLQLPPDRFLALEAAEKGRIALELHEGDLQGHGLAGLQVDALEDRGHAAAADQFRDLKPSVERLTDFHFMTHRLGNLPVNGQTAVEHHFFHAVDANDLHGEIILGPPFFRQGQKLFARLVRRDVRDDLADLVLGQELMNAVGALDDVISLVHPHGVQVDLHGRLPADAPHEHRSHFAVGRLLGRDQPELLLHGGIGVVGGDLLGLAALHQVGAAIADMADGDFRIAKNGNDQRGGHAALVALVHSLVINGQIRRVDHVPQHVARGDIFFRLAKQPQGHLDRHLTGYFAAILSAHPVGNDGHRAVAASLLLLGRFPESKEIFVVGADRTGGGKPGIRKLHIAMAISTQILAVDYGEPNAGWISP